MISNGKNILSLKLISINVIKWKKMLSNGKKCYQMEKNIIPQINMNDFKWKKYILSLKLISINVIKWKKTLYIIP
jgi:hypothetical protein